MFTAPTDKYHLVVQILLCPWSLNIFMSSCAAKAQRVLGLLLLVWLIFQDKKGRNINHLTFKEQSGTASIWTNLPLQQCLREEMIFTLWLIAASRFSPAPSPAPIQMNPPDREKALPSEEEIKGRNNCSLEIYVKNAPKKNHPSAMEMKTSEQLIIGLLQTSWEHKRWGHFQELRSCFKDGL